MRAPLKLLANPFPSFRPPFFGMPPAKSTSFHHSFQFRSSFTESHGVCKYNRGGATCRQWPDQPGIESPNMTIRGLLTRQRGRVAELSRAATLRGVRLGEVVGLVVLVNGAVDRLLEDGLGLVDLELALEISGVVGDGAAIGATAGVGKAEWLVGDVVAEGAPGDWSVCGQMMFGLAVHTNCLDHIRPS